MAAQIAIVTHAGAPDGLPDDRLLGALLERRGIAARYCVWNDPLVDWTLSPLTIIRSTWDYFNHAAEWFAWIDRARSATRVANGWDAIRWNSDKRYLEDLAGCGVRCAPTRFATARSSGGLAAILEETGWRDVIVKPTIAGGAKGARRFRPGEAGAGEEHLAALLGDGAAIVQPYLPSVETALERSIVFIEGRFTHAWRKPAFNAVPRDFPAHRPDTDELALAGAAIAAVRAAGLEAPVYARVDMAPDEEGPVLMELELIEPDLGLRLRADAAAALAAAIERRL